MCREPRGGEGASLYGHRGRPRAARSHRAGGRRNLGFRGRRERPGPEPTPRGLGRCETPEPRVDRLHPPARRRIRLRRPGSREPWAGAAARSRRGVAGGLEVAVRSVLRLGTCRLSNEWILGEFVFNTAPVISASGFLLCFRRGYYCYIALFTGSCGNIGVSWIDDRTQNAFVTSPAQHSQD